eukprot:COSAG01_NODE_9314_length_2486_cov_1.285714_2_plen_120_part_00
METPGSHSAAGTPALPAPETCEARSAQSSSSSRPCELAWSPSLRSSASSPPPSDPCSCENSEMERRLPPYGMKVRQSWLTDESTDRATDAMDATWLANESTEPSTEELSSCSPPSEPGL